MQISGVDAELSGILENALVVPPGIVRQGKINQVWLSRYRKDLQAKVSAALEPLGYFSSAVADELTETADDDYLLNVTVTPGPPVLVTELVVEMQVTDSESPLPGGRVTDFPLREGDILRQNDYDAGKAALLRRVRDLGYLDAHYTDHRLEVSLAQHSAVIRLVLVPGTRYLFGDIRYQGTASYDSKYLSRYLTFSAGEGFDNKKILQTQAQFINSDLFKRIAVVPLYEERDQQRIPVEISLTAKPRYQLRPGIGYGTDTGARISLNSHNYNLWQRGHELNGQLLLAERKQSVLFNYMIPDVSRLDRKLLFSSGFEREDTAAYLSRKLFSEVELQQKLTPSVSGSLFTSLNHEYSDIAGEIDSARILLHGIRLTLRRLDQPVLARKGLQLQTTLQGSMESALSDTSLLQLQSQLTYLHPFAQRWSLLLRLQGGTTWLADELDSVPASLRFFAGGDRSVRGFAYKSLGPKDDDGDVVGGKNMLAATAELEYRLTDKWGVATFYDTGNAFDSFSDYELAAGAGVGVRYYSIIGPFRLDLARQLSEAKNQFRVHLSVGIGW